MEKGFATKTQSTDKTKKIITSKEPKGRLIPWSPWPPANFQTRYPAFPLVLTSVSYTHLTLPTIYSV